MVSTTAVHVERSIHMSEDWASQFDGMHVMQPLQGDLHALVPACMLSKVLTSRIDLRYRPVVDPLLSDRFKLLH